MMGYGFGGWGTGWGLLGWLHMGLWWILVILGIAVLAKWLFAGRRARGNTALEILRERYARGEIGKDEFERKKKDIAE